MKKILILLCVLFSIISCRTSGYTNNTIVDSTETPVPIYNTKIEYRDKLVYDSIYNHDSIYLYIKGDTVIKYKEKINTRYINKTDTIIKTDTIKVPITTIKKITNTSTEVKEIYKLYWWQKCFMWVGILALISVVIFGVLKLKKHV